MLMSMLALQQVELTERFKTEIRKGGKPEITTECGFSPYATNVY